MPRITAADTTEKRDDTDYNSFDDMARAHRIVMKSIINKDMHYDIKETIEINNGFGKQINYVKVKLEAYKLMKIRPKKKDLLMK